MWEFEPRVTQMRARLQHLEAQMQHLQAEGEMEEELRLILGRLETFAAQVHHGLQQADFHTRREIIRSLVKRVEVDQQHIRVVFRVSPTSGLPSSDSAPNDWQDSGRRVDPRAFHGHVRTRCLLEPIGQRQQIGRHRAEDPYLFDGLGSLSTYDEARRDGLFVDVEATAAGIQYIHQAPPEVETPHGMPVSCRISAACFRRAERQTVVPPSIQALLLAG